MSWLRMPGFLRNALATELPRLEAQESMLEAQRVALGTGRLERRDARRLMAGWQSAAGAAARRPQTREEVAAIAAAAGLTVERT